MKLTHLTERIWVYPFEEERDRPNLGYIRGDRWSLAVDAGHSAAHTREFYRALEDSGLPLPRVTVLTHWHWDHTFGMHAVNGLCLANEETCRCLKDFRGRLDREGTGFFFAMDGSIRREYAGGEQVTVMLPDLVFRGEMRLDAGACPIRVFQAASPHTADAALIHVPGEGVLFLGDAACGAWPGGQKDPALAESLAGIIRDINPSICLEGHWTPQTAEELIADMMG